MQNAKQIIVLQTSSRVYKTLDIELRTQCI